MTSLKLIFSAVCALSLSLSAFAAGPGTKADHYLLTPAIMAKFKALQNDPSVKASKDDDSDDDKDDKFADPVDSAQFKLDKDPRAKAALAKHGLSTKDMAYVTVASMHAAFYLMGESVDKKKSLESFNTFTKEQKANIALMRSMGTMK